MVVVYTPMDQNFDDLEDEQQTCQNIDKSQLGVKQNINIIFIGHVDAGKSTIGGNLIIQSGRISKRTIDKLMDLAKELNRESWYLSYALDTNQEERERGKTVEVALAFFSTEKKFITVLDAPGHKAYVPNMINGVVQADVAVLVISARVGEFEAGFEKGGQTREHTIIARASGVKYMIVLINKMDDPSVNWSEERYKFCMQKLAPFLKQLGFSKHDCFIMPCSGYTGSFLKEIPPVDVCPWFRRWSFTSLLDNLEPIDRKADVPVRFLVADKATIIGTILFGKLECGTITKGQKLIVLPSKASVTISQILVDEFEIECVIPGYNIRLRILGSSDDDISTGSVLCSPEEYCSTARNFIVNIFTVDLSSIICPGFPAVMHLHHVTHLVKFKRLLSTCEGGGEKVKNPRFIRTDSQAEVILGVDEPICVAVERELSILGRIIIRDEGRTIAFGKVVKLIK